jgi:hypothetical protein
MPSNKKSSKKPARSTKSKHSSKFNKNILQRIDKRLLIFIVVFSVVGIYTLFRSQAAVSITGLQVSGNRIVNAEGAPVRVMGVNHSGSEYACSGGWGFFDGPNSEVASEAMVQKIAGWKSNAVRVPLNEHCWLDINSNIPAARRGVAYQKAITDYVTLLNKYGIIPILELHYHAPGSRTTANNPMPNRDNSPRFWTSVASTFKGNTSVMFELLNEPHPDNNGNTAEAWRCWRDGGTCSGVVDRATGQPYIVAGMQELVTSVRNTGARNVILLGGIQYTNRMSGWLAHKPTDPINNTAAAWHVYDFNQCKTTSCLDTELKPIADKYPLVTTEIGPDEVCDSNASNCKLQATGFNDRVFAWLDSNGVGYLAWTYNNWTTDNHRLFDGGWDGPLTSWGVRVRDSIVRNATPTVTPTPDTSPPTISVNTIPASLSGTVSISASARDNVAVTRVRYYLSGNGINNTLIGDSLTATNNFSVSWDTTKYSNASYTIYSQALDAAGNVGTSALVTTAVNNTITTTPTPSLFSVNDNTIGTNINQFSYIGTWSYSSGASSKYNGDDHYSSTTNSYALIKFDGTQIKLYGSKAAWHGIVGISIDNGPEQFIDQYSISRTDQATLFTSPILSSGIHTLKLRVTGTKNSASTGTTIAVDRVDIVGIRSTSTPTPTPTPTPPPITDSQSPTITITRPLNNATVGWSSRVSIKGSDNIGVTWMEMYIDGTKVATASQKTDLTYRWSPLLPPSGKKHIISAKAFDAAGNWSETSSTVTR